MNCNWPILTQPDLFTLERPVRMQQNLGVPVDPPVELVIRIDRIVNVNLVAHDETWLCSSRDDQVAQIAVVSLDIALAGPNRETFLEKLAKGDQDLALCALLVGRAWVLGLCQLHQSWSMQQLTEGT